MSWVDAGVNILDLCITTLHIKEKGFLTIKLLFNIMTFDITQNNSVIGTYSRGTSEDSGCVESCWCLQMAWLAEKQITVTNSNSLTVGCHSLHLYSIIVKKSVNGNISCEDMP